VPVVNAIEELKKRFRPEAAKNVSAVYLITVEGSGGGSWLTTVNDGEIDFIDFVEDSPGNGIEPDCKISVSSENLELIMEGKLSAMTAALSGLLAIEGELGLAMQLVPMFFDAQVSLL
jgi:hypothetical protein